MHRSTTRQPAGISLVSASCKSRRSSPELYLGVQYSGGKGTPRDDAEAFTWTQKAAEHNLVMAQRNLGKMFYRGSGVSKDYGQAVAWWSKAANQNDGEMLLGNGYYNGEGVSKDDVTWWTKAAIAGKH